MCGIVGVYNQPDAAELLRSLLHGLQNRGQEAVGVVTLENAERHVHREEGRVTDSLTPTILDSLEGNSGIGHVRYSTVAGSQNRDNVQPLTFDSVNGQPVAIAHNGNFTNCAALEATDLSGTPFVSRSDTERFFRLILKRWRESDLLPAIAEALERMEGACSAVFLRPHELVAIRDARGVRPLYWAKRGDGYVVASETCALDDISVFAYQEIPPGTIMSFSPAGIHTITLAPKPLKLCSFEWVYFAFPTSTISGISVPAFRHQLGVALAKEYPINADVVCAVPDSSNLIARGYAATHQSIIYDPGLIIRKHNTGRTFTAPGQAARKKAVADKFSFQTDCIRGRRVLLIDDSLVRGTTSKGVVQKIRERGAAEVHMLIGSPPVIGACHYGINTPHDHELMAAQMDIPSIARTIGLDSINFLSMERFQDVISRAGVPAANCCFACMDRQYWHSM